MITYKVLARKWRPKIFNDVVGQQHVLLAIKNSFLLGRIHHAYLLSGMRGIGKTTIARIFAKGLNCQIGITYTPCGKCNNCIEIDQGKFFDLIEIDAASRTKVDDIKEILENIQYSSVKGRFKIYIIDEVHMLSRYSFNTLLKTLEEPPIHVKFILATTNQKKIPVTILSRCLQFNLKAINISEIKTKLIKILNNENIKFDLIAIELISKAALGSMRDALSLADHAIVLGNGKIILNQVKIMLGKLDTEIPLILLEDLSKSDGKTIIKNINKYAEIIIDWEIIIIDMLSLLHRIALYQILPNKIYKKEHNLINRLINLSKFLSSKDIQYYYQILLKGRKELRYAPNIRMGLEMILLRALSFKEKNINDFLNENILYKDIFIKNKSNTNFFINYLNIDYQKNIENTENNNFFLYKIDEEKITYKLIETRNKLFLIKKKLKKKINN